MLERGAARRWSSNAGLSRILQATLTEAFKELNRLGIRVNAILPGPSSCARHRAYRSSRSCSPKIRKKAPARARVSIDDVGAATALLALDAARRITGDTIYVDGGYHIVD